MEKKSSSKKLKTPPAYNGLQVNFCKNPVCSNYGVTDKLLSTHKSPYKKSGAWTKFPTLHCKSCGAYFPIKSNYGISEEIARISDYLNTKKPEPSCPDSACPNHGVSVKNGQYKKSGKTAAGSQRYQCKLCKSTFIGGQKSTAYHKKPHLNRTLFTLLVNKMPIRRICKAENIEANTLYNKIDFFYDQCLKFAADKECGLHNGSFKPEEIYISVDRQDYIINWTNRKDRRNTQLSAIGSACNRSSYVFGIHLNYDPDVMPQEIELEARALGEYDKDLPYRKYAHLWLYGDYFHESNTKDVNYSLQMSDSYVERKINYKYYEADKRIDVESPDDVEYWKRLPTVGMQTHTEYTMYAHFFFLHNILKNSGRTAFYLDQESGIRAACLAAFQNEVRKKTCDAFYVSINKNMTVNEKRKLRSQALDDLNETMTFHGISEDEARRLHMLVNIANGIPQGKYDDHWVDYPFPDMSEPEKRVCHLTDHSHHSESDLADLYLKANTRGIDRFFMQIRRALSPLERALQTSSSSRRTWNGYSPYNPKLVEKLLGIYRVYYNFIQTGEDSKTPAQRLGVTKYKYDVEDVIYY